MTTSPLKFCLALALGAALAPAPGRAACLTPAPTVVWSYPAEGQTDVPTNGTVWLLLSNGHTPDVVFIDDQPIPANMLGFGFEPTEALTPNSLHVLSFLATPEDADVPVQLSIRFTTGPGPSEEQPPAAPFITAVTAPDMRELEPRCQAAVQAMTCQAQGADTHLVLANPATPLLWVVERIPAAPDEPPLYTAWPGDCGLPEIFTGASVTQGCDHHYRLHAMTATGLRATGKPVCPGQLIGAPPTGDGGVPPDDPDGSSGAVPPDDPVPRVGDGGVSRPAPRGSGTQVHESAGDVVGGCGLARAPASATALLPLLVLAALRRRRRQRISLRR